MLTRENRDCCHRPTPAAHTSHTLVPLRNHGSDILRLYFPYSPPNTQPPPHSHRNSPRYVQFFYYYYYYSRLIFSKGQPSNILYSYLHTNFVRYSHFSLYLFLTTHSQNLENYLLTPSPQGDLCVAKLFPPRANNPAKASASDPGHGSGHGAASRVVRCEASRNLKWSITNTGVISPIYKLALPSPDSPDLPLFQISKPNPNAAFWSMFYFAYAGHNIPPKRIEFGKIQKNPPGPNGGGTRITISGKSPEEKAVWQTLGEGNEDCVEWVVLCAALNLLE